MACLKSTKTFCSISFVTILLERYYFNMKPKNTIQTTCENLNEYKYKNILDNYNEFEKERINSLTKMGKIIYSHTTINKKFIHLSNSFNLKVQQIFNIKNVKYKHFENYDFNKLSDLFLNIHIFVN